MTNSAAAAGPTPPFAEGSTPRDTQLIGLIEAISQAENHGEALQTRDYVYLVLVTVALPVALILVGVQL